MVSNFSAHVLNMNVYLPCLYFDKEEPVYKMIGSMKHSQKTWITKRLIKAGLSSNIDHKITIT